METRANGMSARPVFLKRCSGCLGIALLALLSCGLFLFFAPLVLKSNEPAPQPCAGVMVDGVMRSDDRPWVLYDTAGQPRLFYNNTWVWPTPQCPSVEVVP